MNNNLTPFSDIISLKGKTAIVTGGAVGIGYAICYRLAEAGAIIIIADINKQNMEQACDNLSHFKHKPIPVLCDVSNEENVQQMVSIAIEKTGSIDILVNNAGIYPQIPLLEICSESIDRITSTNIKSTFLCCREASQSMIKQKKGGCIINLASIDAVHPSIKGLSLYDASKGAILSATRSLALELGQHDIRVNAIAPGGVLTEGVLNSLNKTSIQRDKSQLKTFMSRMVLGRMGRPDDIARVALFLASDLSSYITGTIIFVDGGFLLG